jgi:hypothetical protein
MSNFPPKPERLLLPAFPLPAQHCSLPPIGHSLLGAALRPPIHPFDFGVLENFLLFKFTFIKKIYKKI